MAAQYKVDLCEDCIVTDAYGAPWGDSQPDAEPMEKLAGYLIGTDNECRNGECEGHFGYVCDGCNTQYAGTRYCYIATPKGE